MPKREEVVRGIFEEFARGESEFAFTVYHPNIVWDGSALGPEAGELASADLGHDGVRRWWRAWLEAWERIEVPGPVDYRSNGNQVVASWVQENVGRGSGIRVEQQSSLVFTFEDGMIVRVGVYPSRERGLRAAGMAP